MGDKTGLLLGAVGDMLNRRAQRRNLEMQLNQRDEENSSELARLRMQMDGQNAIAAMRQRPDHAIELANIRSEWEKYKSDAEAAARKEAALYGKEGRVGAATVTAEGRSGDVRFSEAGKGERQQRRIAFDEVQGDKNRQNRIDVAKLGLQTAAMKTEAEKSIHAAMLGGDRASIIKIAQNELADAATNEREHMKAISSSLGKLVGASDASVQEYLLTGATTEGNLAAMLRNPAVKDEFDNAKMALNLAKERRESAQKTYLNLIGVPPHPSDGSGAAGTPSGANPSSPTKTVDITTKNKTDTVKQPTEAVDQAAAPAAPATPTTPAPKPALQETPEQKRIRLLKEALLSK